MNISFHGKRSYHPLLIVLFHLHLLDKNTLRKIPYSTRSYWSHVVQEDQFGYAEVKNYLDAQLDIRAVYTSKLVFRFCRFVCRMHDGYRSILRAGTNANAKRKEITKAVEHLALSVSVPVAARLMNITHQSYYRLRRQVVCARSKLKKCFRSLPQQLSLREISIIDKAVTRPENFGKTKATIFHTLRNAEKLFCSLSTFYEYTRDIATHFKKPSCVRKKFRATKVFQYLHVDLTELVCTEGKAIIAFVKDNFSKAILGWMVLPDKRSVHIRNLFENIFDRYRLHDHPEHISIVSDGGPENKGELLIWIAQQVVPVVKKLTAGIDVRSNCMSESVHHILKNEFLRGKIPDDPPATIERFVHYHNHERYPVEHHGYTCHEVLMGSKPDSKRFTEQLKEARKKRLEENKNIVCLRDSLCRG